MKPQQLLVSQKDSLQGSLFGDEAAESMLQKKQTIENVTHNYIIIEGDLKLMNL